MPQIRHIQSALLYFPFLYVRPPLRPPSNRADPKHHQHFGLGAEEANQSYNHLSSAISAAQWLGLDRLGNDPSGVPMQDLAFCDHPRPLAFELCKRLYHHLSFLDGSTARRQSLARLAQAPGVTALPGHFVDDDLMLDPLPNERPATEVTAATIQRVGSIFATSIRTFLGQSEEGDMRMFSDETQHEGLGYEDIQRCESIPSSAPKRC